MSDRFEIYCHTAVATGKKYVGVTKHTMAHRWKIHVKDAKGGSDYTFHRAIRKYGPENFTHEILDVLTTEAGALKAEQLWIKELDSKNTGYNSTDGGRGTLNPSPEAIEKLRIANTGKKHSPEARAKMSASAKGVKESDETRARKSAAFKGRKKTPEQIAKTAQFWTGRKHSAETLAKMSASKLGVKHTAERNAAKSARQSGKKRPEVGAALLGKKRPAETCEAMRAAWVVRKEKQAREKGEIVTQ